MSYYHGRKGDFFSSLAGSGVSLGLTALGGAIGGPIGAGVGALAGTIGSSFGSAMGELAHTKWFGPPPWESPEFKNVLSYLQGGVMTNNVGGSDALPSPAYSDNFGYMFSDPPLTRAGPPIEPDWENPDTTPPIYEGYTNMQNEALTFDRSDYGGGFA